MARTILLPTPIGAPAAGSVPDDCGAEPATPRPRNSFVPSYRLTQHTVRCVPALGRTTLPAGRSRWLRARGRGRTHRKPEVDINECRRRGAGRPISSHGLALRRPGCPVAGSVPSCRVASDSGCTARPVGRQARPAPSETHLFTPLAGIPRKRSRSKTVRFLKHEVDRAPRGGGRGWTGLWTWGACARGAAGSACPCRCFAGSTPLPPRTPTSGTRCPILRPRLSVRLPAELRSGRTRRQWLTNCCTLWKRVTSPVS